jgi:hypothetical protein
MTFVSIATLGSPSAKIINPATVVTIEDNGDGTGSISFVGRPNFTSSISAAAIAAALGLTTISVTRSGNSRSTIFNPANIVLVEPWTNVSSQAAGCQISLPGNLIFYSDTPLATVLALIGTTSTIPLTRIGNSAAGMVTRSQVMTVDPRVDIYSGATGSMLQLLDGRVIQSAATAATILAALNA